MTEIIIATITALGVIGGVIGYLVKQGFMLGKLDQRLTMVEDSMKEISEENKYIQEDLTQIKTILSLKYKSLSEILSQRHSPRTLSPLGEKIFNEMGGKTLLEQNKDVLFEKIDKYKPKAALDVENYAQIVCLLSANDDMFLPIKRYVYNCPMQKLENGKEYEVTMEDACHVLSLPLRDMYLEKHPEML